MGESSPQTINRRKLARGAAWSVPVVLASAEVPVLAASAPINVSASVCRLFYGTGTVNYQTHSVNLGVSSELSTVPKGTVFTWTVALDGAGSMKVPATNYSQNGRWNLSTSAPTGTDTKSFTVSLSVDADDVTVSELNCAPQLIWADTNTIAPESSLTITGSAAGPLVTGTSSSLSYTVDRRYPTSINSKGRRAHIYRAKSGAQSCYPAIQYLMTPISKHPTCGNDFNDTSTIYPDGTCAKIAGTTADQGTQITMAERC